MFKVHHLGYWFIYVARFRLVKQTDSSQFKLFYDGLLWKVFSFPPTQN